MLEKIIGGKFLKKLWCCVGGGCDKKKLVLSTELIMVISHYKEFLKLQRRARNCLQGLIYIINSGENKNKLASKTIILLCFSFIYHYRVSLLSSVCWSLGNNLYVRVFTRIWASKDISFCNCRSYPNQIKASSS